MPIVGIFNPDNPIYCGKPVTIRIRQNDIETVLIYLRGCPSECGWGGLRARNYN